MEDRKTPTLNAFVQQYLDQGAVVIPLKPRTKTPAVSDWQNHSMSDVDIGADFPDGSNRNIGVVLGSASKGLVDIDLDCPEAVRMAEHFLPKTDMVFGRQSNPKSHYIYRVTDCGRRQAFIDPGDGGVLVEYRGDGCQTMVPPSIHPSGEAVQFYSDGMPAILDHDALQKNVSHLASAALLARYWVEGKRHDIAMAFSGTLLSRGWYEDDVEDFIGAVCVGANDNEVEDRMRAVRDTKKAQEEEKHSTGLGRLKVLIGDSVVDRIVEWLDLNQTNGIGHNSQIDVEDPLRCSDIGNAGVFASQHRHQARYCFETANWLTWNGKYWQEDDQATLARFAEQTVRGLPVEAQKITDLQKQKEFLDWVKRSGNEKQINSMIKLARHHVHVDQDQLDRDDMLLNADGVTINLSDGTTKPNDPSDFCTKITRATYDPDTKCPLFLAFLDRIMGGSEPLKSYLQRAVGYSLTGNMEESCFFIAHGSGANGKSVFLNLIRDLAGAYGQNMAMSTLMQKSNSGQIPSDLARLPGIRIVTAIEGEENQKLAESTVKQLTGGDMITARHLFKKWFDFKPKLKIWMATNFRPKVSGEDQAMWRRIHLVPFNVVIPAEERDGKLPEKLREEFPGILNWAIEGAKQWRQMGLQPPKEVTDATSEYQHEMDTFSRFCSDTIIRKAGAMTGKTQALNSYNEWRKIEGGEELTLKSFRDKMLRLGYEEDRKGNLRFWKDVEFISHDPFLEDIELRD